MDRTQTSLGRYRPWIMLGAPILMAALWALFQAKPGIGTGYLISWLLVLYLGQSILTIGPISLGRQSRARLRRTLTRFWRHRHRQCSWHARSSACTGPRDIGWHPRKGRRSCHGLVHCRPDPMRRGLWRLCAHLNRFIPASTAGLRFADVWALVTKPDLVRLFLAQLTLTLGPGWMTALYIFFFTVALGFSHRSGVATPATQHCSGRLWRVGLLSFIDAVWQAPRANGRSGGVCAVDFLPSP